MASPEQEPRFGQGEIWFTAHLSFYDIEAIRDKKYPPLQLFEEKKLIPAKLVWKGRKMEIKKWFLLGEKERDRRKRKGFLWADLYTGREEVWVVRRNPEMYPVRIVGKGSAEVFYKEEWSIFSRARKEDFINLSTAAERGGRIRIPGTNISIRF